MLFIKLVIIMVIINNGIKDAGQILKFFLLYKFRAAFLSSSFLGH